MTREGVLILFLLVGWCIIIIVVCCMIFPFRPAYGKSVTRTATSSHYPYLYLWRLQGERSIILASNRSSISCSSLCTSMPPCIIHTNHSRSALAQHFLIHLTRWMWDRVIIPTMALNSKQSRGLIYLCDPTRVSHFFWSNRQMSPIVDPN